MPLFLNLLVTNNTWTGQNTFSPPNNVIEFKNGTTSQQINLYNSFTNTSNYSRAEFTWSSNQLFISGQSLGTGPSVTGIFLRTGGTNWFGVGVNSANWNVNSSGNLQPNSNAFTINLGSGADVTLSRSAAAVLQLGAANAASPVAQTLQAQGSRSGTDTNVGGATITIQAGTGTGTGTEAAVVLKSPVRVASGTGAQTQTTSLTLQFGVPILPTYAFAGLPATPVVGMMAYVSDSSTATWGATIAGGGANKVVAWYNNANWTVMGA